MITGLIIFFVVFVGLMSLLTMPKQLSPEKRFKKEIEYLIMCDRMREERDIRELEKLWKGK